jgi:hypothetical protein
VDPAIGNWGRWGPEDERGALNRLDARATLRGIASVQGGVGSPINPVAVL